MNLRQLSDTHTHEAGCLFVSARLMQIVTLCVVTRASSSLVGRCLCVCLFAQTFPPSSSSSSAANDSQIVVVASFFHPFSPRARLHLSPLTLFSSSSLSVFQLPLYTQKRETRMGRLLLFSSKCVLFSSIKHTRRCVI